MHWSHIDQKLHEDLSVLYPRLILIFIPKNCTSKLQPLDVGVNGPFKKTLKSHVMQWISDYAGEQLEAGKAPKNIKIPTDKQTIAPKLCTWVSKIVLSLKINLIVSRTLGSLQVSNSYMKIVKKRISS